MARLSDTIEEFIKSLFEGSDDSELQIQRNELANYFSCAPSQINYVLTTRFTTDKGYYIESRRGGGGYIVIKRIEYTTQKSLIDIINDQIGDSITYDRGAQIINGLVESQVITIRESNIMKVAINDRVMNITDNKNKIRAEVLRAMVVVLLM